MCPIGLELVSYRSIVRTHLIGLELVCATCPIGLELVSYRSIVRTHLIGLELVCATCPIGLGLTGVPVFNVNNNCSSGSTALMMASLLIKSGYDCTMAVGEE